MLWADDSNFLHNNYYSQVTHFKTLQKWLDKDSGLKSKYFETSKEDLDKDFVIPVKPHDLQLRSAREWYLPHYLVLIPNKPGQVRRILNGASKLPGQSLNKFLLVGPNLMPNLFHV